MFVSPAATKSREDAAIELTDLKALLEARQDNGHGTTIDPSLSSENKRKYGDLLNSSRKRRRSGNPGEAASQAEASSVNVIQAPSAPASSAAPNLSSNIPPHLSVENLKARIDHLQAVVQRVGEELLELTGFQRDIANDKDDEVALLKSLYKKRDMFCACKRAEVSRYLFS